MNLLLDIECCIASFCHPGEISKLVFLFGKNSECIVKNYTTAFNEPHGIVRMKDPVNMINISCCYYNGNLHGIYQEYCMITEKLLKTILYKHGETVKYKEYPRSFFCQVSDYNEEYIIK